MKIKNITMGMLIAIILVSCAPMAKVAPTETAIQTSTFIIFPPTSSISPPPENISSSEDLTVWVEEFVHAYDGKVTVNGIEMNASQLTDELRENSDQYIQSKRMNDTEILFLVINGIPLALRAGNTWQEATMAKLGEIIGVGFECSLRLDARKYQEFLRISEKALGNSSIVVLTTNLDVTSVFGDFTEDDWQNVLDNWDHIQSEISSGLVPDGYPFDWHRGVDGMDADVIRAFGGNPQFRSSQLYETGIRPDGIRGEALRHFQGVTSHEDMLKIFEFVIRSRVIRFPEIMRWDVSDEVSGGYLQYVANNLSYLDFNFWGVATGLNPSALTAKVAEWVKRDNPDAKTFIVEDYIFDTGNPVASELRDYFYNVYIPEVVDLNDNHIIDGVIGENNWWIGEPQDWITISRRIDFLNQNGFEIGGSETMIISGNEPTNFCCGRKMMVEIPNAKQAQADMYAQWLDLYLDKGVKIIGFGNIDDFYAWTQDAGLPEANPTLFDIEFRAKPAYYSIVKTLYEHIP